MGELLRDEIEQGGGSWSVERRFRVTEVFLAVLWVCLTFPILYLPRENFWRTFWMGNRSRNWNWEKEQCMQEIMLTKKLSVAQAPT